MRQAAYEAGLGSDRLPQQILIALEPEAASLFCRQLKVNSILQRFQKMILKNEFVILMHRDIN